MLSTLGVFFFALVRTEKALQPKTFAEKSSEARKMAVSHYAHFTRATQKKKPPKANKNNTREYILNVRFILACIHHFECQMRNFR